VVGSIIIPKTVKVNPKTEWGTVVKVGLGTPSRAMEVVAGERVCFTHNPNRLAIGENILLHLDDILFHKA
jgi:co-chaperonin GroES (HSP10)